jgi:hypothetical protein
MYERAPKPFEMALKPEHTSTLLTVNDLDNPTETTVGLEPSLPSKVAQCTIAVLGRYHLSIVDEWYIRSVED